MELQSVEAVLLHGHFSLNHKFNSGVNVIFGKNGGGKTTLLNILANALYENYSQFAFIDFRNIKLEFDSGDILTIAKTDKLQGVELEVNFRDTLIFSGLVSQIIPENELNDGIYRNTTENNLPRVLFFPAYRILYDYRIASSEKYTSILPLFSPKMSFPNLHEIEDYLKDESSKQTISSETAHFLETINRFYENKKLVINSGSNIAPFEIIYDDNTKYNKLNTLSSGERQLTSIIFALSHFPNNGIVLIDEPEISLHVEWQRKILRFIQSIFKPSQIIACTHSPIIGADYELKELEFRFAGK